MQKVTVIKDKEKKIRIITTFKGKKFKSLEEFGKYYNKVNVK